MLQITVFLNGSVRRYVTKDYAFKNGCKSEIDAFNYELSCVSEGDKKIIAFIDEVTDTFVYVSPITCLIEVEEMPE